MQRICYNLSRNGTIYSNHCYSQLYSSPRQFIYCEESAPERRQKAQGTTASVTKNGSLPPQNDLPIASVKKNPLQHIFLTEAGKEKRVFPTTNPVCENCRFFLLKSVGRNGKQAFFLT